jgi:hypothetical protein
MWKNMTKEQQALVDYAKEIIKAAESMGMAVGGTKAKLAELEALDITPTITHTSSMRCYLTRWRFKMTVLADLAILKTEVAALQTAVAAISSPASPAVDFAPVLAAIAAVDAKIGETAPSA